MRRWLSGSESDMERDICGDLKLLWISLGWVQVLRSLG